MVKMQSFIIFGSESTSDFTGLCLEVMITVSTSSNSPVPLSASRFLLPELAFLSVFGFIALGEAFFGKDEVLSTLTTDARRSDRL